MGVIEPEGQGSAERKVSRELVAVVQHWPDEGSVLMWLAEHNPAARAESADEFLKSMGPAATHFRWGSKIELFAYDEEMPEGLSPTKLGLEMDQGGWSRQVRSLARSLAKEGVSLKLATAATVDGVETLKEYGSSDSCVFDR